MREMGRRATASRRGPQSGPRHGRDETGAVLVLALIFLLVAGVIIGSLVSWSSNDLLNTGNLQGGRSLVYSAGGATDVAIQSARYTPPDSLTTAFTAGQTGITQLADTNGLNAPISAGDQVTIGSGATAQTVTATASAAINATTVSVASFTSTYAQPVNTVIYDDACNGTSPAVTIGGNAMSVWCNLVWTPESAATRVETFSACPSTQSAAACAASPYVQAVVTFDDYPTPIGLATTSACTTTCGTGMTVDSWVVK
jgi:hypothetical protein